MGVTMSTGRGGERRTVATWWRSRYGAQLLFEIALCGAMLMVYRFVRSLNRTDLRAAFANTREIVRFEQWLGLPFEDNLQRWLIDHEVIVKLLNHYYIWFHFPAVIGLLVWLYFRHPDRYAGVRNLLTFVTFSALVIHLLFPLAPPRMMAGFVDTMSEFGPSIYPANALDGAANQIAAMPSLHFGWAMIEAMAVISVLKSRWRYLVIIHPALMTLSIIGTANHWWIDAAAAAAIVVAAVFVWRVLRSRVGDRHWSWTAMRFRSDEGIAQLESLANASPSNRSCVTND